MKIKMHDLDIFELLDKKYGELFNIDNLKDDDYFFLSFDTILKGFTIGVYKRSFGMTSIFVSLDDDNILDKDTVMIINDYPAYYKLDREDSEVLVERIMSLLGTWFEMGKIKHYSTYYRDGEGVIKDMCIEIDPRLFTSVKGLDDFLGLMKELKSI